MNKPTKAWYQRSAPKSIPKPGSKKYPDGIYLDQIKSRKK